MEKNENKTGIEPEKLLNLVDVLSIDHQVSRQLSAVEYEDFFPELTKEFDNLKKELESSTFGYENRFVSAATKFLENLVQKAFDVMVERLEATYNERLEVQDELKKVVCLCQECQEMPKNPESFVVDLNTKSAIALQSVIPQLRKIIQVYYLPLKDENAAKKGTKGSYLLGKIEQVQEIIAHFNSKTVNSETYINYENSLLNAYILVKRIEEEDALFSSSGFSEKIERVCDLLESEKDIPRLSKRMSPAYSFFEAASHLLESTSPVKILPTYSFFEEACHIYSGLIKDVVSILSVIISLISHRHSSCLPNLEFENRLKDFEKHITLLVHDAKEDIKENNKEFFQQAGFQHSEVREQASMKREEAILDLMRVLKYEGLDAIIIGKIIDYTQEGVSSRKMQQTLLERDKINIKLNKDKVCTILKEYRERIGLGNKEKFKVEQPKYSEPGIDLDKNIN